MRLEVTPPGVMSPGTNFPTMSVAVDWRPEQLGNYVGGEAHSQKAGESAAPAAG
jgi:hypothetical protein